MSASLPVKQADSDADTASRPNYLLHTLFTLAIYLKTWNEVTLTEHTLPSYLLSV